MIKTAGQKIQGGEPQALCGGKSELNDQLKSKFVAIYCISLKCSMGICRKSQFVSALNLDCKGV